jgi:dUTP pyrophosphatase
MEIKIKILDQAAALPKYATAQSAGLDLIATENIVIEPMKIALISTGICIALTQGYEMQIRPRSGLALKHGVTVVNAPGTIDADYRGEIKVILINLGEKQYQVQKGDKIAQAVVCKYEQVKLVLVENLEETERGSKGFGSTGK